MDDIANLKPSEFLPLENSESSFRALRPKWIDPDSNEILAVAYRRRESPKDEKGISVNIRCTVEFSRDTLQNCKAVAKVSTGDVRALEPLDIVPDSPNHANIIGIPRYEEDALKAEDLIRKLIAISTIAWKKE